MPEYNIVYVEIKKIFLSSFENSQLYIHRLKRSITINHKLLNANKH